MPFKNPKPEYAVWQAMKQRCFNKNNQWYKSYGGRGIKVCERWNNSFKNFFKDMGECPKTMSLEREDNDGDYKPSNCYWASKSIQSTNQRKRVDNTTGYIGVYYRKEAKNYFARVQINGEILLNKTFDTLLEAVTARNNYITNNNLPHKVQDIIL